MKITSRNSDLLLSLFDQDLKYRRATTVAYVSSLVSLRDHTPPSTYLNDQRAQLIKEDFSRWNEDNEQE